MSVAVAFWSLASVVLIQSLTTLYFICVLKRKPRTVNSAKHLPSVAIILCLRGSDPFLCRCIHALLNLDYPDYQLHLVIDNENDPAREIAERAIENQDKRLVSIQFLSDPSPTCSLKCSSLIQAIENLDENVDVIALVDADTIVHRTWLSELVQPLADQDVAVATGSRWYLPNNANLGTLVRYVWNAAAVVQMVCFDVAWGGTLAIKRSFINEADLVAHWKRGFCEDTLLHGRLTALNRKQVFVPSLLMANRESCSMADFMRWMVRQLITSRLYHPSWPGTVIHGILATTIPMLAMGLLLRAVYLDQWTDATKIGVALMLFEASLILLMLATQWVISGTMKPQPNQSSWPSPSAVILLPLAIVATQLVYPIALPMAIVARRIRWRGIDYQIEKGSIRMKCYQSFQQPIDPSSSTSL